MVQRGLPKALQIPNPLHGPGTRESNNLRPKLSCPPNPTMQLAYARPCTTIDLECKTICVNRAIGTQKCTKTESEPTSCSAPAIRRPHSKAGQYHASIATCLLCSWRRYLSCCNKPRTADRDLLCAWWTSDNCCKLFIHARDAHERLERQSRTYPSHSSGSQYDILLAH